MSTGPGLTTALMLLFFSKENEDLSKTRGVKTLISGLPAEVSALVKVLSWRK